MMLTLYHRFIKNFVFNFVILFYLDIIYIYKFKVVFDFLFLSLFMHGGYGIVHRCSLASVTHTTATG